MLARFNQIDFESDAARERARKRLLNAAKKYRIVPVGFITRQPQSERKYATALIQATALEAAALPTGFVTLLMSDIEGSTVPVRKVGDRYGALLNDVRGILRAAVSGSGGHEIDARADEFFAVFERAGVAVEAAVAVQRDLASREWTDGLEVRLRIGIHSGHPTLTEAGYIGLAVHTTARVCAAAHGSQIVASAATRTAIGTSRRPASGSAAWGAIGCPAFRTRRCSSRCRPPGCAPASRRREYLAARRSAGRTPGVTPAPKVSSNCPSRPLEAAGRLGLRHRELSPQRVEEEGRAFCFA